MDRLKIQQYEVNKVKYLNIIDIIADVQFSRWEGLLKAASRRSTYDLLRRESEIIDFLY